jgi:hypothetical protein
VRVPPRIEIPRADLEPHAAFGLPLGFRLLVVASTLAMTSLSAWVTWAAPTSPHAAHPQETRLAVAAVFWLLTAFGWRVVAMFGDRVETTPDELRYRPRFGRLRAVTWSRIESLRERPLMRRLEVHSPALARPIRLELQLGGIDELLMIVAERTFRLQELRASRVAASDASRSGSGGVDPGAWSIEREGLAAGGHLIPFRDITDVRIVDRGSATHVLLLVVAERSDGAGVVIHDGIEGLIDRYQTARRAHRSWAARSGGSGPA